MVPSRGGGLRVRSRRRERGVRVAVCGAGMRGRCGGVAVWRCGLCGRLRVHIFKSEIQSRTTMLVDCLTTCPHGSRLQPCNCAYCCDFFNTLIHNTHTHIQSYSYIFIVCLRQCKRWLAFFPFLSSFFFACYLRFVV